MAGKAGIRAENNRKARRKRGMAPIVAGTKHVAPCKKWAPVTMNK
jgi:hypothetical protein